MYTRESLFEHLMILLSGRIAEEIIFGHDKVTSGASSDIDMATKMAKNMVTKYGAHIFTGADLYSADVDIYSPCALGATINDETISKIQAKVIAGAANNQLANELIHGKLLKEKGKTVTFIHEILFLQKVVIIDEKVVLRVPFEVDVKQKKRKKLRQ